MGNFQSVVSSSGDRASLLARSGLALPFSYSVAHNFIVIITKVGPQVLVGPEWISSRGIAASGGTRSVDPQLC